MKTVEQALMGLPQFEDDAREQAQKLRKLSANVVQHHLKYAEDRETWHALLCSEDEGDSTVSAVVIADAWEVTDILTPLREPSLLQKAMAAGKRRRREWVNYDIHFEFEDGSWLAVYNLRPGEWMNVGTSSHDGRHTHHAPAVVFRFATANSCSSTEYWPWDPTVFRRIHQAYNDAVKVVGKGVEWVEDKEEVTHETR